MRHEKVQALNYLRYPFSRASNAASCHWLSNNASSLIIFPVGVLPSSPSSRGHSARIAVAPKLVCLKQSLGKRLRMKHTAIQDVRNVMLSWRFDWMVMQATRPRLMSLRMSAGPTFRN